MGYFSVLSVLRRNASLLRSTSFLSKFCHLHKCVKNILAEGPCEKVLLNGWVERIRKLKDLTFIHVNDGTSAIPLQVILPTAVLPSGIDFGSSISVTGRLRQAEGARTQTVEMDAEQVTLLGQCPAEGEVKYPFHLQKKNKFHSAGWMRQYPHLRTRTSPFSSLLRVRHTASAAAREYLHQHDFCEVHTPLMTTNDCEGAGETFVVSHPQKDADEAAFFKERVHLTVSGQLHLEAAACGLCRAYCLGPVWRAENSVSKHHLSEFYMLEAEMCFTSGLHDVIDVIESLVKHVCRAVRDAHQAEIPRLVLLGNHDESEHSFTRLVDSQCALLESLISRDYAQISYTEAARELGVTWGVDLSKDNEKELVARVCEGRPVFVTGYPRELKAFYARAESDGKTVSAVDLLLPGVGEVCGGSLREERLDTLTSTLVSQGMMDKYQWYLDTRRFGSVAHGGFGVGFERLLQALTGVTNIRDTIPFPRWPGNCRL